MEQQQGLRKCMQLIHQDVAHDRHTLVSNGWCLDHVTHLIFETNIRRFTEYPGVEGGLSQ